MTACSHSRLYAPSGRRSYPAPPCTRAPPPPGRAPSSRHRGRHPAGPAVAASSLSESTNSKALHSMYTMTKSKSKSKYSSSSPLLQSYYYVAPQWCATPRTRRSPTSTTLKLESTSPPPPREDKGQTFRSRANHEADGILVIDLKRKFSQPRRKKLDRRGDLVTHLSFSRSSSRRRY